MRERKKAFYSINTDEAPHIPFIDQGKIIPITRRLIHVETSGQVAFEPNKTELKLIEGGIKEQTQQTLENVGAILSAGGARPGDAMDMTVWLADFARDFVAFNDVYKEWEWASGIPPTRATVGVQLFSGALVEVKGTAVYRPILREAMTVRRKLKREGLA